MAIIPPKRGEFVTRNDNSTHRFQTWIESLTLETNDLTDRVEVIVEEDTATEGDTSRLLAIVSKLDKRVVDLESANDIEILRAKIAKLNQKVNKLIKDLIAEIVKLQPNTTVEAYRIELQEQTLIQLQLLSARVEEAFETQIEVEDM